MTTWQTFVRQRRTDLGMTQVQLSEATGIPQSHISRWENGGTPPTRFLARLIDGLEITPDELAELLEEQAA